MKPKNKTKEEKRIELEAVEAVLIDILTMTGDACCHIDIEEWLSDRLQEVQKELNELDKLNKDRKNG